MFFRPTYPNFFAFEAGNMVIIFFGLVRKRIRIREVNRKARLSWCRGNRNKTVDTYWNRVIFSDECNLDENERLQQQKNYYKYCRMITNTPYMIIITK
jgi:hypothetical protein